uniref:ATP synthase F0 subunit 8 n=1 Tax=Laccotrephes robustus TaxID=575834 RepID=C5HIS9_9HEMI|nr:ATP synthase F0 subunit 8 [Laccotrephes robustus]ACJ69524.1 ATP synthase F0 subunit 8 [Laccotrephes robustus]
MPQMSPLWWSCLFIMFIAIFMSICMMMYTIKFYKPESKIIQMKDKISLNWMW